MLSKMKKETLGLWLGVLGVVIFAFSLPMTRLAVGTLDAPQLSGVFVALGRAAVAGILSLFYLAFTRAPRPARGDWALIALTSAGVVFGFPLLTSIAMRHVESVHASVMLGVLPLATAMVGAFMARQRPSLGFWLCAFMGSALVMGFALLRNGTGGLHIQQADGLLLLAMLCAAVGYATGARLSAHLRADHVICWALVIALPLNLPAMLMAWPAGAVHSHAWWGFAYVSLFSMWLGFFAWYKGLALGGTVRVSQVQLIQPFLTMVFSLPLLGERLDAVTLGFSLAVIATVFVSKKMPINTVSQPLQSPFSKVKLTGKIP
jgi:drug/metabolite transporter (DMT)-like permease